MNNLLNKQLKQKINNKNVQVLLGLSSTPCQGQWLSCRVVLDGTVVFNDVVEGYKELQFEKTCENSQTSLSIIIDSKDDNGTSTDSAGNILENQSISITTCKINGANIIDNGYIYKGTYTMVLDEDKQKHFKELGYKLEHNDYKFYENGTWTLELPVPTLAGIIKSVRLMEKHETVYYSDIIDEIIERIEHDNSK